MKDRKRMVKAKKAVTRSMKVIKAAAVDVRGLTGRDRLFVTNVLKGMPKTEAMKLAAAAIGMQMTDAGANQAASKTLDKPAVESAIVSALEAAGVTDEKIAKKIDEGLDATAFTQTGIEHDDFKTRLGYIQTVLRVKGQLGADVANQNQVISYTSFKGEDNDE